MKFPFKYTRILFLICFLRLWSQIHGQSFSEEKKVTLNCRQKSLRAVLEEITKQTETKFVYNDVIVDGIAVSCEFRDTPIEEALHLITKPYHISFQSQSDKWIVLFKRSDGNSYENGIQGRVIDDTSKTALIGADVFLAGTTLGSSTDENGDFNISGVPNGYYDLECRYIGYETEYIKHIAVAETTQNEYHFNMKMKPLTLRKITVTPSNFAIMGDAPVVYQTLTRNDIESVPQFGEDIFWAVRRLPGLSTNDFSARFTVRGGEHDQILVLMDGLELFEPFHLKHIYGGALSILDATTIEGIDLMTGAFTAEYGNRLSGVFRISSKKVRANHERFSLGMSFMNARFKSEGTFSDNRGSWLLSARRGYFGLILKLLGSNQEIPLPLYSDILGKLEYRINEHHTLSINMLHASDNLVATDDNNAKINDGYGDTYGWLRLQSVLHPNLYVQTIVSLGRINHERMAINRYDENQNLFYSVSDRRYFHSHVLKQDWNIEASHRFSLKYGFDLKYLTADYDYFSTPRNQINDDYQQSSIFGPNTLQLSLRPTGNHFGAYFATRFRLISPLTMEIGIRYDRISYTKERHVSPRLNMVFALGRNTTIRGGWGHFYQSQGIHQLEVQDGEYVFFPAECAEQRVIGIEHLFSGGIHFRVEGYHKNYSRLRPEYRNWEQRIDMFPEMLYDRYKMLFDGAAAKGIELFLKKVTPGKFNWWIGYSLASVQDQILKIIDKDGEKFHRGQIPSVFDQRHTFRLDLKYRPASSWQLNLAWQYHTGCPYTELVSSPDLNKKTEMGEYNESRYPPYHRMDLRINRFFTTSRGRITAFLEIMNIYNRENVAYYDYTLTYDPNQRPHEVLVKSPKHWFALLPSFGISLSWN